MAALVQMTAPSTPVSATPVGAALIVKQVSGRVYGKYIYYYYYYHSHLHHHRYLIFILYFIIIVTFNFTFIFTFIVTFSFTFGFTSAFTFSFTVILIFIFIFIFIIIVIISASIIFIKILYHHFILNLLNVYLNAVSRSYDCSNRITRFILADVFNRIPYDIILEVFSHTKIIARKLFSHNYLRPGTS